MRAWSLRTQLARVLGFDIPRLNARIDAAGQVAERLKAQIAALELENARLRALPAPAAGSDTPAVPVATRLRDMLTALFEQYETTSGISCDAYCDTPQWHAMAEAQYLEAVMIAHTAGLLSDSQAGQRARASVVRLQAGALHRDVGSYAQWGLGFRYQDFRADEPFLVTTALVTRALIAARDLAGCADLAREGLAGLARLPRTEVLIAEQPVALPVYAPSLPEAIENSIALWAGVVLAGIPLSEPAPSCGAMSGGRSTGWTGGSCRAWAGPIPRPARSLT
jgi:hypothetical protein